MLVQPEMERGRSPLVSIPPFGRGFSRHRYDHQAIPQHGCVPAEPASVSPGKIIVAPPCSSVSTSGYSYKGVGQEQFMEFRRASGPYGDFAWRKNARCKHCALSQHARGLQFVFCMVRSEILYLPHILGTAGFGYGQESPVGRWDCKPDKIAGTEQE